ncbi:uncharacterized protein B0H18DRAFT_399397 [Fomitopsis serialis]|uniref:uncharacterized protein n=1 Tax=Fomitopsis serialis TaxID=139415 RepID=UPI002008B84E|nr:uncharacterized protein B0H18DRAFT_399397 [Neoantrodia serialis]KAH9910889.1 hypothetical protein B0H18DRAFT_399397 [Neoantrodia serialis]
MEGTSTGPIQHEVYRKGAEVHIGHDHLDAVQRSQSMHLGVPRPALQLPHLRARASHGSQGVQGLAPSRRVARSLLLHGGTWYYCGTYKCTGMSILRLEDLCKLDESRSYALFNSLAQQTPRVLGGEFQRSTAKTMGAITKALRDLYWDGTLPIRCYGFQLVGYDEKVKAAFVKCQASVKQKKDKKRQKAQKKGGKKRQRLS